MSASHHFSCLPACAHAHTCAHSHTAATCPLLHTACFFLPARAWTLSTSARSSCSWWTRPAGGRGQCVVGGWVAHWLALAGGWRLHVGSSSSPSPPSITLQTAHPGPPVHPQAPVPPLSMPPRPHSIVLPPLASQPIVAGPAHPAPLPAHPPCRCSPCRGCRRTGTPQCFLLTPKLLPDLPFTRDVTVLQIMNGNHIKDVSGGVVPARVNHRGWWVVVVVLVVECKCRVWG